MTAGAIILLAIGIGGIAWGLRHQRRAAARLWRQYPLPWLTAVAVIWRAWRGKDGK